MGLDCILFLYTFKTICWHFLCVILRLIFSSLDGRSGSCSVLISAAISLIIGRGATGESGGSSGKPGFLKWSKCSSTNYYDLTFDS
mgnify:CR=1 FL=1